MSITPAEQQLISKASGVVAPHFLAHDSRHVYRASIVGTRILFLRAGKSTIGPGADAGSSTAGNMVAGYMAMGVVGAGLAAALQDDAADIQNARANASEDVFRLKTNLKNLRDVDQPQLMQLMAQYEGSFFLTPENISSAIFMPPDTSQLPHVAILNVLGMSYRLPTVNDANEANSYLAQLRPDLKPSLTQQQMAALSGRTAHETSATKPSNRSVVLLSVAALCFALSVTMFATGWDEWQSLNWAPVQVNVAVTSVVPVNEETFRTTYLPCVVCDLTLNNKQYKSSTSIAEPFATQKEAERELKNYPAGTVLHAFCNPKDPTKLAMHPPYNPAVFVLSLAAAFFLSSLFACATALSIIFNRPFFADNSIASSAVRRGKTNKRV